MTAALLLLQCDNTNDEKLGSLSAKQITVTGSGRGSIVLADGVITVTDDKGRKAVFDALGAHAAPVGSSAP